MFIHEFSNAYLKHDSFYESILLQQENRDINRVLMILWRINRLFGKYYLHFERFSMHSSKYGFSFSNICFPFLVLQHNVAGSLLSPLALETKHVALEHQLRGYTLAE